jgi:hypothetical protein
VARSSFRSSWWDCAWCRTPSHGVADLFDNPFYSALALAAAFALIVRERLQRWLDRRFFRDAHDRERLLLELVSEIKHHDTLSDLVALVSRRIERALHPQQVHVCDR